MTANTTINNIILSPIPENSGTVVGFTVGVLNPINTGLAQKLSGIPVFSGIGLRIILFIVVLALILR